MSDKPNLQLGDPPSGLARRQTSIRGVWLLAVLQIVTLVAVGLLLTGGTPAGSVSVTDPNRLEEIRATAISLEDRSLAGEAASAWQEYLRLSPEAVDRAKVLYRVGGLLMESEDFSGAVTALVGAEQLATDDADLKLKVGPKIVECLRRLGHYGEVGRELSRQVEVGGDDTAQGTVLATFAGETFTEADLDRMIERTVDRVLAMQPGGPFQLNREQLLHQYESGEARQRILQEMIQRELFSRRARDLEIDRQTSFQQTREFLETELLASEFLSRELAKIQPTDVDIESFYSANTSDYRQPETASVIVLPLNSDQSADDVLTGINSREDFQKLADESNGDAAVAPVRIVKGQPHPRLGDTSTIFSLAVGEWTKTPVESGDEKLLVLLDSKTPATTPPLDEIRFRVESDYRRRKQQELTQRLSADLMSRYDVKIMAASAPSPEHEDLSGGEPDATPTDDDKQVPDDE